jgi:formamidopyrimidine-DNA glycosylase
MPELPEVETTRRGIEPAVCGERITALHIHDGRLRWPVDPKLPRILRGQCIHAVRRRGKYLLLQVDRGTLIIHLGMSGSLRVLDTGTPHRPHDHIDLVLASGHLLRFNDPRRFGCWLYTTAPPEVHPLLQHLAPEPLETGFDADYLFRVTRDRRVAIKPLLMNSRLVTGVGNIYANEALFLARIRPSRAARRLDHAACSRLVRAIRTVLRAAIRSGGTTLRDFIGADGRQGYFRQKLHVYGREGLPCRICGTLIRESRQGQRSTCYCPHCQQ